MKQRTITSIFIALTAILLVAGKFLPLNIGTYIFDVFVVVVAMVSVLEMCNIMEKGNASTSKHMSVAYPIINYVVFLCTRQLVSYKFWGLLQLLTLIVYFLIILIAENNHYRQTQEKHTLKIGLNTLKVCFYPGLLFSLFLNLNHIDYYSNVGNLSIILIVSVLVVTFLTDTFAYLVGCAVRGPKLAPKISPNKTISGAIGGLFGGVAGAVLVFTILSNIGAFKLAFATYNLAWWQFVLVGLFGSALGQCGDLLESKLKRWAGVKDSGKLFPGHGGMLDRIDAMMLVVAYVFLVTLIIL
mgnify:CR=1 FL=1